MRGGASGGSGGGGRSGGGGGRGRGSDQGDRAIRRIYAPRMGASLALPIRVVRPLSSPVLVDVRLPESVSVFAVCARLHVIEPSLWPCEVGVIAAGECLLAPVPVNVDVNTVYDTWTDGGATSTIVDPQGRFVLYVTEGEPQGLVATVYVEYRLMRGSKAKR